MSKSPYSKRWFHAAMDEFEKLVREGRILIPSVDLEREDKEMARLQRYYCNGEVNLAFIGFLHGLSAGRVFWTYHDVEV